jgi:hypothetical protein
MHDPTTKKTTDAIAAPPLRAENPSRAENEPSTADAGTSARAGAASMGSLAAHDARPGAVVPVKGSLRQDPPRPSFWRRLSLRATATKSTLPGATADDRLLARLDALSNQLEATATQIRQLDERFAEVWEVEEQLSRLTELREMVEDMRERQGRADGRLRGMERRLSLVALLAGVAAVASLAGIVVAVLRIA